MTALPGSGSFAMVDPTHVAAVGPAAAILYARIEWRARESGQWYATRRTLMQETGLSDAMLRTAAATLRDQEWVTAVRASAEDATLIWTPVHAGQRHMCDSPPPPVESATPPLVIPTSPPMRQVKKTPPSPNGEESLFDPAPVLRAVPTTADLDAEFDRFWSLYPRRTAKKAARVAYGRARRTATVQQIATGLRSQLPALSSSDPQYIPHPTTWLNQGRWEDEVAGSQGLPTGALPPPRTDPFAARG